MSILHANEIRPATTGQGVLLEQPKIEGATPGKLVATDGSGKLITVETTPTQLDNKADKIVGGTEDNIVTRDASGNIKDGGKNIASLIPKSDMADNLTTNDDSKVLTAKQGYNLQQEKIAKVIGHTTGNLASLTAGGEVADSGFKLETIEDELTGETLVRLTY